MRARLLSPPLRRVRVFALAVPSLSLILALHLGWGSPARSWQDATGWRRLVAAPAPRSWIDLGAGEEPLHLQWLGHAGFVVDWQGTRLLLDPNTRDRCTIAPRRLEPGLSAAALGRVDAALISHAHYDHLDLPTLAAVPSLAEVVLPAGSEVYVEAVAASGTRIVGLAAGQSHRVGNLEVIAVPSRHNGSRLHPLASRQQALGYVVRSGKTAFYFAGDTGYGPHLAAIGRDFHPAVAILPIGAFRPWFPLHLYHLAPEEAVQAARDLGARVTVPSHFGTFVLSLDATDEALPRFARAARRAGLEWRMPSLR
ncbi:MAG TPA: MBL fold metallo-hydrolase [Thermoanaerobaculia bacterium]|nr:MBL fold metallo-hydrolase [Thermoanaerobaculia bacterium]